MTTRGTVFSFLTGSKSGGYAIFSVYIVLSKTFAMAYVLILSNFLGIRMRNSAALEFHRMLVADAVIEFHVMCVVCAAEHAANFSNLTCALACSNSRRVLL